MDAGAPIAPHPPSARGFSREGSLCSGGPGEVRAEGRQAQAHPHAGTSLGAGTMCVAMVPPGGGWLRRGAFLPLHSCVGEVPSDSCHPLPGAGKGPEGPGSRGAGRRKGAAGI